MKTKILFAVSFIILINWTSCDDEEISTSTTMEVRFNDQSVSLISNFIYQPVGILSDTLEGSSFIGGYKATCKVGSQNIASFEEVTSIEIVIPNNQAGTYNLNDGLEIGIFLPDLTGFTTKSGNLKNEFTLELERLESELGLAIGNFNGTLYSTTDSIRVSGSFSSKRLTDYSKIITILGETCK